MELKVLNNEFVICKINDISQINFKDEFCFVGKTDEELSLVCSAEYVPDNTVAREDGWRAFRIQGCLDFSLIGILSKISAVLAESGIGIYAVSTYNTDYILVKGHSLQKALNALRAVGYSIIIS